MRRLPIRPRHIAGAVVLLAVLAGLWYTRPRPLAEFAGQSAMEITAITAQVTRYVEGDTPGAASAGQRREISLTAGRDGFGALAGYLADLRCGARLRSLLPSPNLRTAPATPGTYRWDLQLTIQNPQAETEMLSLSCLGGQVLLTHTRSQWEDSTCFVALTPEQQDWIFQALWENGRPVSVTE